MGAAPPPDRPRSGRDVLAAALRESAEEAAASLRSAAEDARAAPLFGEDLAAVGLDHDRREAMDAAFNERARDMERELEQRRPRSNEPEGLADVIGHLARAVFEGALIAASGASGALEAAYDGHPWDFFLGTPLEARAHRAAVELGDGEAMVRVLAGEDGRAALQDPAMQLAIPADELAAEVARRLAAAGDAGFDSPTLVPGDMTFPEFLKNRDAWVYAALDVARYSVERCHEEELDELAALPMLMEQDHQRIDDSGRRKRPSTAAHPEPDESAESFGKRAALAGLSPEELLIEFAKTRALQGFAVRDPYLYNRVKTIETRVARHAEKFSRGVYE